MSEQVVATIETPIEQASGAPVPRVLVCLGASFAEPALQAGEDAVTAQMEALTANVLRVHPHAEFFVAYPGYTLQAEDTARPYRTVGYATAPEARVVWLYTADDYRRMQALVTQYECTCCVMLGSEGQSIDPGTLASMIDTIVSEGCDLVLPRYDIGPDEGLITSAMLYPLTRSIYGPDVRFPLPLDLALSARMAERLAASSARLPAAAQVTTLLWPVAEAATAGFRIGEVHAGRRQDPQGVDTDLKVLLAQIAGSLFADIEVKAAYWQRTRPVPPVLCVKDTSLAGSGDFEMDKQSAVELIDNFRLAYGNLHEIWSLVLPPNSLLGLKKLSLMPSETFRMPDALWVRVVYDFVLAHRLRTINRGHLLGALTPLYLAWVASYILQCSTAEDARRSVEALALAFEADKPYLVSRWRWPDRFNP